MDVRAAQYSQLFLKRWDPDFATNRRCKVPDLWRNKGVFDGAGGGFGNFFWELGDLFPSCNAVEIEEFISGIPLKDVLIGASSAGRRQGAWLDDRVYDEPRQADLREQDLGEGLTENGHCVSGTITATSLFKHLKDSRFDHPNQPDFFRRLIFIQNLDPHYVLALSETAELGHVSVLKDAIWKHIAFQTSFQVEIPEGYSTFQMEIHLPFFGLRARNPNSEPCFVSAKYPNREWIDLSFLNIPTKRFLGKGTPGIQEAHFSLIISGTNNRRWFGCAFADSFINDNELEYQVLDPESNQALDPISDGSPAENPIWDPREYYLVVLSIQTRKGLQEWTTLVRTIKGCITEHESQHASTLSKDSNTTSLQAEDPKKTYDWTQQTTKILNRLEKFLSATIKAWEGFVSPDGDIGYFLEEEFLSTEIKKRRKRMARSLHSIKRTIEGMSSLKVTLEQLKESCQNSAEALQLRLHVEGTEGIRNTGHFTSFGVSVIAPVMAAIALYSIPETSAPLKLDSRYFMAAVVLIAAAVQLLFLIIQALPGKPWWWKRGGAWRGRFKKEVFGYFGFWRERMIERGAGAEIPNSGVV